MMRRTVTDPRCCDDYALRPTLDFRRVPRVCPDFLGWSFRMQAISRPNLTKAAV